jgi:hypothetical protein
MTVELPELPPGWRFEIDDLGYEFDWRTFIFYAYKGNVKMFQERVVVGYYDSPEAIEGLFRYALEKLAEKAFAQETPDARERVIAQFKWAISENG